MEELPIRVIVAEDKNNSWQELSMLLEENKELTIVGKVSNEEVLLKLLLPLRLV